MSHDFLGLKERTVKMYEYLQTKGYSRKPSTRHITRLIKKDIELIDTVLRNIYGENVKSSVKCKKLLRHMQDTDSYKDFVVVLHRALELALVQNVKELNSIVTDKKLQDYIESLTDFVSKDSYENSVVVVQRLLLEFAFKIKEKFKVEVTGIVDYIRKKNNVLFEGGVKYTESELTSILSQASKRVNPFIEYFSIVRRKSINPSISFQLHLMIDMCDWMSSDKYTIIYFDSVYERAERTTRNSLLEELKNNMEKINKEINKVSEQTKVFYEKEYGSIDYKDLATIKELANKEVQLFLLSLYVKVMYTRLETNDFYSRVLVDFINKNTKQLGV